MDCHEHVHGGVEIANERHDHVVLAVTVEAQKPAYSAKCLLVTPKEKDLNAVDNHVPTGGCGSEGCGM